MSAKRLKPGMSTKLILGSTAIIALFILLMAFSFQQLLTKNENVIKNIVLHSNDLILLEKVRMLVERISGDRIQNSASLAASIKRECARRSEFLYVIVYAKTADENYFTVQQKIPLSRSLHFNIETDGPVQENKEENYIKKGLVKPIVEPVIYRQKDIAWQNVYHPFAIQKRHYVLAFSIASHASVPLQEYTTFLGGIRNSVIAGAALMVIIILIVSLLFHQNFTLLIRNLSRSLKRAARGELDINLNPESDVELSELALSFNSLIDEIKELKEKEKIIQDLEKKDTLNDIFKYGVNLLKENTIDDAITIFRALILLKPESFGSYFNLGVAYAKKKQYDISEKMFWKAYQFNPENELILQYIDKVKRLRKAYARHIRTAEE